MGVFNDLTAYKDEVATAYLQESATNDCVGLLTRGLPLLPQGGGRNNDVRARGTFRNCLCHAGLLRYHLAVTAA
jgi:hypothetical protein